MKKILRLQTEMNNNKPIALNYKPEMDELTISEMLDIVAAQYEKTNKRVEANVIRGLANRVIVHNNMTTSPDTKIKDLIFELKPTKLGEAMIADISFQQAHVGGQ